MTDWCVWQIGPRPHQGATYRLEETSIYDEHYSREPLIRKSLTQRQAFLLADFYNTGAPIYCQDLLPEDGQRVRFWVDWPLSNIQTGFSGWHKAGWFEAHLNGVVRSFPVESGMSAKPTVYAWEPEPPVPPLPESGK